MTQLGAALWTSRFLLPRREKRGCLPTRTGQHLRSGIRHTDGFSHSKGNACYYQIRAPRYLEMNLSDSDKEALRGFRDAVPYSRDRLRKGDLGTVNQAHFKAVNPYLLLTLRLLSLGRICIIGGSEE